MDLKGKLIRALSTDLEHSIISCRLIVVSEYEPFSMVDRLAPYLGGSASIVVHSPHLQVHSFPPLSNSAAQFILPPSPQILTDLQSKLRQTPCYLAPSITESWLRRYQVLPGRTHPTMATSGSGGFLLHTTKVYDPSPFLTSLIILKSFTVMIIPRRCLWRQTAPRSPKYRVRRPQSKSLLLSSQIQLSLPLPRTELSPR